MFLNFQNILKIRFQYIFRYIQYNPGEVDMQERPLNKKFNKVKMYKGATPPEVMKEI